MGHWQSAAPAPAPPPRGGERVTREPPAPCAPLLRGLPGRRRSAPSGAAGRAARRRARTSRRTDARRRSATQAADRDERAVPTPTPTPTRTLTGNAVSSAASAPRPRRAPPPWPRRRGVRFPGRARQCSGTAGLQLCKVAKWDLGEAGVRSNLGLPLRDPGNRHWEPAGSDVLEGAQYFHARARAKSMPKRSEEHVAGDISACTYL